MTHRSVAILILALPLACTPSHEDSGRVDSLSVGAIRTEGHADSVVRAYRWSFGQSSDTRTVSRYAGGSTIFSNGKLVLTLDTATLRTGNALLSGARADSTIVTGVRLNELLASFCRVAGQDQHGQLVGLIQPASQEQWTRARLTWVFDTSTARIRGVPPDSTICAFAPEGY